MQQGAIVVGIIIGVAAFIFGASISAIWRRRHICQELARYIAEANEKIANAKHTTNGNRLEGEQKAAAERQRFDAQRLSEAQRMRNELAEYDSELQLRSSVIDNRERALQNRNQQLQDYRQELRDLENTVNQLTHTYNQAVAKGKSELELKCGQTTIEVRNQLVREAIEKAELNVLMRLRENEATQNEMAAIESRRIMQTVIERYDGASHLERVQNTIYIEDPQAFAAMLDPAGACRVAFFEETACELVLDEEQHNITVRGEDPLAREIARRILVQLHGVRHNQGDKIHSLANQIKMKIDREVQNAGRKALRALGLDRVHPDVLQLVGRLKFRLSYSQNQWRHAIEVGQLAGLLAAELKLDTVTARRGGLLHDIGKAMTHDHDGSHAILGANVARECGEDEVVVNAIASHHNDEPATSPIALIVTAADALSGGRPGARRESVTQYLTRIQEIQRIASTSPAVQRVDIMQAGREVRVVVAGNSHGIIDPNEHHNGPTLDESELQPLAHKIAQQIENELTFAGQIKITIIRESKIIAVAP